MKDDDGVGAAIIEIFVALTISVSAITVVCQKSSSVGKRLQRYTKNLKKTSINSVGAVLSIYFAFLCCFQKASKSVAQKLYRKI